MMKRNLTLSFILLLSSGLCLAQLTPVSINPDDGAAGDQFGEAVSLSGSRAAISAWQADPNGDASGAVYLFTEGSEGWSQSAKITPTDAHPLHFFGNDVSLDGDRLLVGADFDSITATGSGSAYLFEYDGNQWNQTQKFAPAEAGEQDRFGSSVAISEDFMGIGMPFDDSLGTNSGAAYLYHRSGNDWIAQRIVPATGQEEGRFGDAIDLDGNVAVIGAPGHSENGLSAGSAYIYQFNGTAWVFVEKLLPADGMGGDRLATSVDIQGDRVILGGHESGALNIGVAYLYEFDGSDWNLLNKFTPSDGSTNTTFGRSVAVAGDTVVVGASGESSIGLFNGALYQYIFDGTQWQESKLIPAGLMANDRLGYSLSMNAGRFISGANRSDIAGMDSGNAYLYGASVNTAVVPLQLAVNVHAYSLPGTDQLQLEIQLEKTMNLQAEVLSLNGQLLWTKPLRLPVGSTTIALNTESWASGIYLFRLREGNMQLVRKVRIDQ